MCRLAHVTPVDVQRTVQSPANIETVNSPCSFRAQKDFQQALMHGVSPPIFKSGE